MNFKKLKITAIFALALLVFTAPLFSISFAQASGETSYKAAVKRFRADGFKGVDRAIDSFKTIIISDPDYIPAYISAADAYLLKYEFSENKKRILIEKALELLNTAIEKNDNNHVAYFKRAIVLLSLEKGDMAEMDIRKAMKLRPDFLDARILYIQYLLALKNNAQARKFAESSLKIFPNDPAPMKFFGDVFFREAAYEDAIFFYKKVSKLVKKAPNTHMLMGESYHRLKKYKLAIESYKKAIDQKPDLYEARFSIARTLTDAGMLKEAIGQFNIYLSKFPKHVSTLNNLAILYETTGQTSKAKLAWLKLKEATHDKIYVERAERHLYDLLHKANKKNPPKNVKIGGKE